MDITTRDEGNMTVVMLNGKLDTNTTPIAESEINALIEDGASCWPPPSASRGKVVISWFVPSTRWPPRCSRSPGSAPF